MCVLLSVSCVGQSVMVCCDESGSSPQSAVQKWKVKGQVEKVLWNHFQPDLLLVSRQGGVGCGV